MSFSTASFLGHFTWTCGRMHDLCDLLLRKTECPLQGTGLVQNLEKSPAPSLLPTTTLPSSPSRSSLLGAAVLTEVGSLTLCLPLCVARALGGVCQGAAGTQRRAGRGGNQRHAELRGGPGPDGGDMVQGWQEAEFELKSACGGHGLHPEAGGAAGGQGGRRGVQLRGRGPEGLLPPGHHRSVLGGSQLALCGGDGPGLHP